MKTLYAFLSSLWLLLPNPLAAAPANYVLQPATSTVGFETDFGKDHISGKMPITAADLILDFDRIANCKVAVTLDASNAQASFPFAAQALKGPKVLDTQTYPNITFQSTSVTVRGDGATVTGIVTIRGVSRPMDLRAQIYRQKDTVAGDLRHLSIHLTGAVLRSNFGANGWNDMVGDEVRLDILARIVRVN